LTSTGGAPRHGGGREQSLRLLWTPHGERNGQQTYRHPDCYRRLYPRYRVGGTETLPGQRNILANRHCDRNILDPTSFTHSLPRRRTLPDPTVSLYSAHRSYPSSTHSPRHLL